MESEDGSRDNFLDFRWTSPLHLEFLGSSHLKVGRFQPYFLSDLPGSELGCDSLFHFLLGNLVSGNHIIMGSREIQELLFQIGEEGLAERRICVEFVSHHEREWSFLGYQMSRGVVSKLCHGQNGRPFFRFVQGKQLEIGL